MMHVIVAEGRARPRRASRAHTVGFDALAAHVAATAGVGGARRPACRPSDRRAGPPLRDDPPGDDRARRQLHAQGRQRLARPRAPSAACPRSPATSASPAAASARATAGRTHGQGSNDITPTTGARPARDIPSQMPRVTEALRRRRLRVMLLLGTDMLSSFADAARVAARPRADGPGRGLRPVPERHCPPLRRRGAAGDGLARGARVQEHEHAPLPDAEGARAAGRDAARCAGCCASWRGGWACATSSRGPARSGPIDAILDHPATGHATVAALRPRAGCARSAHLARRPPRLDVPDAVGQDRALLRARAPASGCRRCPCTSRRPPRAIRSRCARAARLTHFHGFYDHGRALPTLARPTPSPSCGSRRGRAGARRRRRRRPSGSTTSAARCGRAPA